MTASEPPPRSAAGAKPAHGKSPAAAVERATIVMAKQLKGAPEKAVPVGDYAATVSARRASAMRLRATRSTFPVALSGMSSSTMISSGAL